LWVEIPVACPIDVADEGPFFGGVDGAVGVVNEEAEGEAIVALLELVLEGGKEMGGAWSLRNWTEESGYK